MESGLSTILTISLVLVTGCIVVFLVFLIQISNIIKRILTKVELRVDNFELTQEDIKLKLLKFVEEVINKIRNYGRHEKDIIIRKKKVPVG